MTEQYRTNVVCVRLTNDEMDRVRNALGAMALSTWLRTVILDAAENGDTDV